MNNQKLNEFIKTVVTFLLMQINILMIQSHGLLKKKDPERMNAIIIYNL